MQEFRFTGGKPVPTAEVLGWTSPDGISCARLQLLNAAKGAEDQAGLMLLTVRDLLVKQRTMLINAIRGRAAEFGVIHATACPWREHGGGKRSPTCSSASARTPPCRRWHARWWARWPVSSPRSRSGWKRSKPS